MTYSPAFNMISFIIATFLTVALSTFVIRRKSRHKAKKNERVGWLKSIYIFLVIGILSFLFIPFSSTLIQTSITYFKLPRYEATVVDIESGPKEIQYSDLEGNHHTRKVVMYTAILEFTDKQGNTIKRLNNINTATKPKMGQKFIVIYEKGQMEELSFRAIVKKFDIGLILSILGYCLLLVTVLIEVMILY